MDQGFDFLFPKERLNYSRFDSINQIKRKLLNDSEGQLDIRYSMKVQKNVYVYFKCKDCFSHLTFKKVIQEQGNQVLVLSKFNNQHTHIYKNIKKMLFNFISQIPSQMPLFLKKKLVLKHFNIKQSQFYYYNRIYLNSASNFSSFIQQLDKKDFQTRYEPYPVKENEIPHLFITRSPQMKRLFDQYGQFCSFDVTYNIIKQEWFDGTYGCTRKWGIGLFLGLNNLNHIIPFAVAIMNQQRTQNMVNLFSAFLQIMNNSSVTFITDQQQSIIEALKILKEDNVWSGVHLLDQYHILKNLRKKLDTIDVFVHLKKALRLPDKASFNAQVEKAYQLSSTERDYEIIKQFTRQSKRYAKSQVTQGFFGLAISTSFGEKCNDILKQYLHYKTAAHLALRKILVICQKLMDNSRKIHLSSIKYEEIFSNPSLKILRFKFVDKVMCQFIKNYCSSLSLVFQQKQKDLWTFHCQDVKEQVIIRDKLFSCSCQILQRTGIPCAHLCKLISHYHQNYLNYFHKRWVIEESTIKDEQHIKVCLGRPSKSRRNRIR